MNLDMQKYLKVRKAQAKGARTIEELKEISDINIESNDEFKEIEKLLQNVCKCKNISVNEVLNAVKNGAETIEKVSEATEAGTGCGNCKSIISNIIENRR